MQLFNILLLSLFLNSLVESIWLLSLLEKSQWRNLTEISQVCELAPTEKTKSVCMNSPQTLHLIGTALDETIAECQQQFAHDKWDCAARLKLEDVYLKMHGKENAFFHSLISMSSSRAVSKACSSGQLSDCTCGELPTTGNSSFIWAGCSDNLKFGNRLTRQIFDLAEKEQNANSLMNIHNNRAGRKLLNKQIEQKCRCHGISGSCVTKTCWQVVPELPTLISMLRSKYLHANQVEMAPNSSSLVLISDNLNTTSGRHQRSLKEGYGQERKPAPGELVFIDKTPDICELRQSNGVPLSVGRECANEQECNRLCCNRGFIQIREVQMERCNCKFVYCCRVDCDQCERDINRFYCK